jgi:probable HAF family extracellular repeat protein
MIGLSRMDVRRYRFGVPIAVAVVALAGLTPHMGTAAAAVSGPTDLGTLGGTFSTALAVNDSGVVVGQSNLAGNVQSDAFLWTQAGGMVDLGRLGGNTSFADAVNASGQVVGGTTFSPTRANHAFSWTQSGGMVDLGTLGGTSSFATAVNDAGQVVGQSQIAGDTGSHGFSWTQSGGMVDLGSFGGSFGSAEDVNASGQVVGANGLSGCCLHRAFEWTQAGGAVNLGTLGGPSSFAHRANDAGQVVGDLPAWPTTGEDRTFSWTQSGGMIDIGTLGGKHTFAQAINSAGQVVGQSTPAGDFPYEAFAWTQAGGMADLGNLGGNYSDAEAINDSGLVVGYSYTVSDGSQSHAFAWTASDGMLDLGTLGGTQSNASAVNASGLVVGTAQTASPETHAAVWHVGAAAPGSADQIVSGGDVVDTDTGGSGPTPAVPVQTRITVPAGVNGEVTITPQNPTAPPAGFAFFGQQVVITAPPATGPAAPYIATFSIDASALGGIAPADVQVFRNGVPVADCTDPTQAVPDPCVAARGLVAGGAGDAFITVRTTQFSTWSVGRFAYVLSGFFASVDNLPTINTVKAGSAVPVKFGLGSDRGLNIFVAGSPASAAVTCGSGAADAVEQTVTAGTSTLTYDSGTARYQYVWKTDKAWKGCRDLILRFRDGSTLLAHFSFK